MTLLLFLEQVLNGLQLGVTLFLMAAGLTLVFGIMDMVNLAHGSLYMMGAYLLRDAGAADRQLRAVGTAGVALGAALIGHPCRDGGAAHPLQPRPSRPGAGDLRPDPVLQRAGQDPVGAEPIFLESRRCSRATLEIIPGAPYPVYRLADARGRLAGRDLPVVADHAHAHRHADPRRRLQPRDGGGAGRRHQAALHPGVRPGCRARRPRRRDGRPDLRGRDRHGRARC